MVDTSLHSDMLRYQHEATSNHNKTCQTGLTHIQCYEDTVDVGVYRDFKHDLNASYVICTRRQTMQTVCPSLRDKHSTAHHVETHLRKTHLQRRHRALF